jgi:hypothetical protein
MIFMYDMILNAPEPVGNAKKQAYSPLSILLYFNNFPEEVIDD